MHFIIKFIRFIIWSAVLMTCLIGLSGVGLMLYLNPRLPSVETIRDVKLQTPLRIYSNDRKLIAEFGEKRRIPISYAEIPPLFIKAVIVAEDDSFEKHHGFDVKSLMRAAIELIQHGEIHSGGSTITMQVARNYFLNQEKSFSRKLKEILLAIRLENFLTKEEILELYFNKIYLGNRAYGIQAAAQIYYGKAIDQLSVAQWAMIAGLPKAPSTINPIANPMRSLDRRNWILTRMYQFKFIDQETYKSAIAEPISTFYHGPQVEVDAPYVAEMVRSELLNRYGEDAYTNGFIVITTINSELQKKAQSHLRKNLLAYTRRHGYMGAEAHYPLEQHSPDDWKNILSKASTVGGLVPGIVTSVAEKEIGVLLKNNQEITINWDGLSWARPYIKVNHQGPSPKKAADIVKVGDLIRVEWQTILSSTESEDEHATEQPESTLKPILATIPVAQSALVSLNPWDGSIISLVGGFDFQHSSFNRATQALRQPGSSFKPFIYLTALESGYTAASIVNDAPLAIPDPSLNGPWRPQNSDGDFLGPLSLREALYRSRNLVSIRLVKSMGIDPVIESLQRFGFRPESLPKGLSIALGTASVTPLEMATAYAVIANGGYRVDSYVISRLEDLEGNLYFQANPAHACRAESCQFDIFKSIENFDENGLMAVNALYSGSLVESTKFWDLASKLSTQHSATRVMDERYVFILQTMLKDVIKRGTATHAKELNREDLAGKTGTTNDQIDAWFSGFNANIVTTAWVGFDQPQSLGRQEYGAKAALPLWMDFMRDAIGNLPEASLSVPEDVVMVKINSETGLLSTEDTGISEWFTTETVPQSKATTSPEGADNPLDIEQLF